MKKALIPLIVALGVIIGIVAGNFFAKNTIKGEISDISQRLTMSSGNKLSDVLSIIDKYYVDTLASDSLIEVVLPELMAKLDPHSVYIPAKDIAMANEELAGSFYGIGIEFNMQTDTIYVINVLSGGPSQKAGVMAGDKIITVDDSVFAGRKLSTEKVMKSIRGDKGTVVKLGVQRGDSKDLVQISVTRGVIPINSIDISYMITDEIGYISVNKFGETTYKEFLNALTSLRKQKAKSLIIDLRGNSGGYLGAAVDMINEFLQEGDNIVYMQGAHQPRVNSMADGTGSFQGVKMAVLVDEFSASASEIFAGAIQDNDRGMIIGRRTFGKGLVQKPIELRDGSEIRLTVAKYYTPSGRCIQKPYTLGKEEEYEMDIINRYNHGEFYSRDSIKENTDEVYYTKAGRKVYGGGGIMPDVFVPSDTTGTTKFFSEVARRGLIYKLALHYTDRNRSELTKYSDWRKLQEHLSKQKLFEQLVAFSKKDGLQCNSAVERTKSKTIIEKYLMAYIIRNTLDDEGFYPFINQTDEAVLKAIEALQGGQN